MLTFCSHWIFHQLQADQQKRNSIKVITLYTQAKANQRLKMRSTILGQSPRTTQISDLKKLTQRNGSYRHDLRCCGSRGLLHEERKLQNITRNQKSQKVYYQIEHSRFFCIKPSSSWILWTAISTVKKARCRLAPKSFVAQVSKLSFPLRRQNGFFFFKEFHFR